MFTVCQAEDNAYFPWSFLFSEIENSTWTEQPLVKTKKKLVMRTPTMEITGHITGDCDPFLFYATKG